MEVLLRFLYGATAVMAVPRRSWRCCGDPTADWPNPRGTAEVLNMLKVSAVPPRRSAVLTVFCGATAINDGTTAEPRRSCRTSTAVAPRLRCDGTSTAEARRNMFKVAAVLPRRSAVLTVFRGATTNNDGTTAEPRRSWRCHCGVCRTSTAVAPRLRCDGGIINDDFRAKNSCVSRAHWRARHVLRYVITNTRVQIKIKSLFFSLILWLFDFSALLLLLAFASSSCLIYA